MEVSHDAKGMPPGYWGLSVCVHLFLLFGTCLNFAYGPERTIQLRWYQGPDRDLVQHFPDQGSLHQRDPQLSDALPEFWKLTGFAADAASYLLQATSPAESKAPYKYRFLPTVVVGALSQLTGVSVLKMFIWFNIGLTLATALLFQGYLSRVFAFSREVALLGAVLFIGLPANTSTVGFPMLEPASLLFSLLIHGAAALRRPVIFAIVSALAVATKEVLVVSSLLWWFVSAPDAYASMASRSRPLGPRIRETLRLLAPGFVPIVAYATIRVAFGDSPASVNYGYNPLRGEVPMEYAQRLGSVSGVIDVASRIAAAYSVMWLGVFALRRDSFLARAALTVPVVVAAAVLLSSSIVRVLGVVFPIVIPAFLLLFAHRTARAVTPVERRGDVLR